jgi:hypothetical protein
MKGGYFLSDVRESKNRKKVLTKFLRFVMRENQPVGLIAEAPKGKNKTNHLDISASPLLSKSGFERAER